MHTDRIPELDGVRGLAILMVFIYHSVLRGTELNLSPLLTTFTKVTDIGWAGVDLFFVLSGYLITSILLETRTREKYYRNFYGRRVLRIFPVYYISLTVIFVLVDSAAYNGLGNFVVAFYLYLQNWMLALGAFALSQYLGHFWSLAIEEQFYLMWPYIVRKLEPCKLLWIALTLVALSPLLRWLILQAWGDVATAQLFLFSATITRFDGLLLGAAVAIILRLDLFAAKQLTLARIVAALSALAALVILYHKPGSSLWYNVPTLTLGFTLIALAGAALIVLLLRSDNAALLRRIFRSPVLLFAGKYSYALYVFHWPLISICLAFSLRLGFSGMAAWALGIVAAFISTVLLALLSWHLVEQRALSLKKHFA